MIIREATNQDIPAIAKVHVDTWKSTYKNIFSNDFLANISYQKREQGWHQIFANASDNNSFTYVIESDANQIVGFANAGTEREGNPIYSGELYAIYIIENFQQQGIGKKLVKTVVEKLKRMQIDSMLVWVLKDNTACSFYENLGGRKVAEKEIIREENKLIEIAYGWKNTFDLQV